MLYKRTALAFFITLGVAFTPASAFAENATVSIEAVFGKTGFTLNGEPLKMDSLLYNGAAYLPAAYIARELGLTTRWDAAENNTYLTYSYAAVEKPVIEGSLLSEPQVMIIDAVFGSTGYFLNGKPLEQECLIYNGTAYLPANYLAKELGLYTSWNPETNITNIVYKPVEYVSLETTELTIEPGRRAVLQPSIIPADASVKAVKFSSDNENIVSVNENGELYAVGEGSAVITCTFVNGRTAVLQVKAAAISTATASPTPTIDIYAYAEEVLSLTNAERAKNGLAPLSGSNSNLNNAAMQRAEEIITVFTHDRPNGQSCFTAFKEHGVTYSTAGENIANGYSDPQSVVNGWMNSPGHRGNILKSSFGSMGVGVAADQNGRLYWVQCFTD